MKRLLSLILVSVFLICSIPFTANAEVIKYHNYNGFVYTNHDVVGGNVKITNYKGDKTKITIPTEIDGKKVESMTGFGKIKQLHIPDGVKVLSIAKAKNLEKVTVNKTNKKYSVKNNLLLNKEKTVLYGCPRKNTNPKIPKTVKTIEYNAFYGSTIKKINLPKNLKIIGRSAFANCKKLESIKFPNKLKTIADGAFKNCDSLKSVKIPNSVKRLGFLAFSDCKKLEKVTLSKNIKYLDSVFNSCESLKEIKIPKKVAEIESVALQGCKSLEKVYIYNKNCKIYREKDDEYKTLNAIPEHVTIYGYKGSTAQKYAKKNGNKFVKLD